MNDPASVLRALHHGRAAQDPLVLPGPWDAASARVFADAGFPALATPSAGVSASLGYPDGQGTPPAEMFAAIGRIARAVDVPVSADVEAGYGLPARELVDRLLAAGAAGCNLEDSDPVSGRLREPREQADRLAEVCAAAQGALVVNARIDTYLRGDSVVEAAVPPGERAVEGAVSPGDRSVEGVVSPGERVVEDADPPGDQAVEDAVARGLLYAAAGADCVYPILAPPAHLAELAERIGRPLNALCTPGGPTPRELGALGATRVTYGGGLQQLALDAVRDLAKGLLA